MLDHPLRLAFALPGFHRVDRGAEVALLSVAQELALLGHAVTVFGSGQPREGTAYRFHHVPAVPRERFERFPFFPPLRSDVSWEDLTFASALLRHYRPADFDAVLTCSFPFTQLALRRPAPGGARPRQIFVTQNGDWPARARNAEYRFFRCDGLVCINPDYFADNRDRWRCALIPNGADLQRFTPGPGDRARFGLPEDRPVVLMVSALIESKRVLDGIRAVAQLDRAHLVVAGDGPLRTEAENLAQQQLPGRFSRLSLSAADMPALYRSADALLHMSLAESFGNVFVEAMACGLPVVGHDSPRLRWIVGDTAFLCDTRDPAALGQQLAAALIERQRERPAEVARFAWSAIAGQYQDFLRICCAAA
ncbi:glycosyltransferase family 4 protein [Novosphingobium piscinae]|uniref:glycosyltransferase family 4 protein n=1 Tax=Novosphingobium piscinae TaxID=1507448 RepID=UPI001C8C0972|nr:glycosyltransferase family 4 protein [Novosphingobium piscinae]